MRAVHAVACRLHPEINLAGRIENPYAMGLAGVAASESYGKAVWNHANDMGWDTDPLVEELGAVPGQFAGFDRFWR